MGPVVLGKECSFCFQRVPTAEAIVPEEYGGVSYIRICADCVDWASDNLNQHFDSVRQREQTPLSITKIHTLS